jgi:hypothetical protein
LPTTAVKAPGTHTWASVLDDRRRCDALAVARDVATRVTDTKRLARAIAAARLQSSFPETVRWEPFGLAEGNAGLALMCGYLDRCLPDEGWDVGAHKFLTAAARGAERASVLSAGAFSGLSGLAFAAASLARRGTRYQGLLAVLDAALQASITQSTARIRSAWRTGIAVSEFDVISGLAGIGAHLLLRAEEGAGSDALRDALACLTGLAESGQRVPRWWTPPHLMGDEAMAREHPAGNLNCGLAHGIPGPLAMLALALRRGFGVPGQRPAIRRMADWLVEQRVDDAWGVNWPSVVPVSPGDGPRFDAPAAPPTRAAWCYGAPGLARSLWLAGDALGDLELCELALESMRAVYRRPLSVRNIDSPTICHGVAGLLQVTLHFAHDTAHPEFAAAAVALVDQLLAAYSPDRLLGYASLEPGGNAVDRAGLLDGAPGIALALLAAGTDVTPAWDRVFLLA